MCIYVHTYKPDNLPRLDSGVGRGLELGDCVYPTDGNDNITEFIPLQITYVYGLVI